MYFINHCRIGGRAAKACEVLHGLGFKQVSISLVKINSQKFKIKISRQELTWAVLKNGSNEVEQSRQIEKDVTISKLHFA